MTDTPDVTTPQSTEGDQSMKTIETLHYGPLSLRVVPDLEMSFLVNDLYDLPFLCPETITDWGIKARGVETKGGRRIVLHRSVFVYLVAPGKERDLQRFFTWADQQEERLHSKKDADEAPGNNDSRDPQ